MTANLYAWEPRVGLNPRDADFADQVQALSDPRHLHPPSPAMRVFVAALLARYPDLTASEDTPWADGPLLGDANGGFINLSVVWSRFSEARAFFLSTAHRLGLDAYDPQDGSYYPAKSHLAAWLVAPLLAASIAQMSDLSRRELLAGAAAGLL